MYEAMRRDHVTIVVDLLRHGMATRYTFALEAIWAKANGSLCGSLDDGQAMNTPINETEPTIFAYIC